MYYYSIYILQVLYTATIIDHLFASSVAVRSQIGLSHILDGCLETCWFFCCCLSMSMAAVCSGWNDLASLNSLFQCVITHLVIKLNLFQIMTCTPPSLDYYAELLNRNCRALAELIIPKTNTKMQHYALKRNNLLKNNNKL